MVNSLKGQASYWFDETKITSWKERTVITDKAEVIISGFEEEFLKKYTTRKRRNAWYRQLEKI